MYIDAYFRNNNDNAKLDFSVPSPDIGKTSCLKFYYHMYGADVKTLNVYNGNTRVFNKSGNQGNVWLTAKITLTLHSIVSCVSTLSCGHLNFFGEIVVIKQFQITLRLIIGKSLCYLDAIFLFLGYVRGYQRC